RCARPFDRERGWIAAGRASNLRVAAALRSWFPSWRGIDVDARTAVVRRELRALHVPLAEFPDGFEIQRAAAARSLHREREARGAIRTSDLDAAGRYPGFDRRTGERGHPRVLADEVGAEPVRVGTLEGGLDADEQHDAQRDHREPRNRAPDRPCALRLAERLGAFPAPVAPGPFAAL